MRIVSLTWAEYMVYRLNFVMWRVRWVMQRLVVYFLWWALFANMDSLFGYTESAMLTYVLLTNIIATFTLSTLTMSIGDLINRGNLTYFLLRPIDFFRFFVSRDVADKLLNVVFAVGEIALLLFFLRPPVFLQNDPWILIFTLVAIVMGTVLYFLFSTLLGFIGFWSADVWAPRFLSFVIMDFFSGGLFPLDILPKPLSYFAQNLPFSYFLYFPTKLYLGQFSTGTAINGFLVGLLWLAVFVFGARYLWQKGLRIYTAEGR